jgi:hypothetical protein
VLFVLAHPDDECAMSPRIARERELGNDPLCVYLTDGLAKGAAPGVREAESRRVLRGLGVADPGILFLGSKHRIPDGGLVLHLDRALHLLEAALEGTDVHRVYCLAHEGGHQDHDASHAVALAFARRRGIGARTWQVPFYTGYGAPWKLFRLLRPLPGTPRVRQRRLPAGLALRHGLLCLGFPSQWKTWIGLFPEFFMRRALQRVDLLQAVDPARLGGRPHSGPLLYEQLQGFPYETFREHMDCFLAGLPFDLAISPAASRRSPDS